MPPAYSSGAQLSLMQRAERELCESDQPDDERVSEDDGSAASDDGICDGMSPVAISEDDDAGSEDTPDDDAAAAAAVSSRSHADSDALRTRVLAEILKQFLPVVEPELSRKLRKLESACGSLGLTAQRIRDLTLEAEKEAVGGGQKYLEVVLGWVEEPAPAPALASLLAQTPAGSACKVCTAAQSSLDWAECAVCLSCRAHEKTDCASCIVAAAAAGEPGLTVRKKKQRRPKPARASGGRGSGRGIGCTAVLTARSDVSTVKSWRSESDGDGSADDGKAVAAIRGDVRPDKTASRKQRAHGVVCSAPRPKKRRTTATLEESILEAFGIGTAESTRVDAPLPTFVSYESTPTGCAVCCAHDLDAQRLQHLEQLQQRIQVGRGVSQSQCCHIVDCATRCNVLHGYASDNVLRNVQCTPHTQQRMQGPPHAAGRPSARWYGICSE